ncbi:MAG: hypothetical protein JF617_15515 [Burkholderiales bacterium]|nr:hypothetical protein [Burkholderiales bacterium]
MSACGGGGDGGSPTPLDTAGAWFADETASGGSAGMLLTVGDTAYGFETQGSAVRYFKGAGYSSDGENYTFGASRYDEVNTGGAITTVQGKLEGKFIPGTSPSKLFITFGAMGGVANQFSPLRADPATANVAAVADLRDFAVRFPLTAGSLTLTAQSATAATLSGTGVNGCTISGTLSQPRVDRNIWAVKLNQTVCSDATRNGIATTGLAVLYKSGAKLNLLILGEDGRAWTLVSSSY